MAGELTHTLLIGRFSDLKAVHKAVSPCVMFQTHGRLEILKQGADGRLREMAVREGFEPSVPCGTHTFQACSFGHSDTSPFQGADSMPLVTKKQCNSMH